MSPPHPSSTGARSVDPRGCPHVARERLWRDARRARARACLMSLHLGVTVVQANVASRCAACHSDVMIESVTFWQPRPDRGKRPDR